MNGITLNKIWSTLYHEGIKGLWIKARRRAQQVVKNDYTHWISQHVIEEDDFGQIEKEIDAMTLKPRFSIILPVYNIDETYLRNCIESVIKQIYPYWELCIADDASTKPHIKCVLEEYQKKDQRIKIIYRKSNGHISAASNSALELATGEFVALLDNDDEISLDALYENARLINRHPEADLIYSDEDKINTDGKRHTPFFKPGWSPELFRSQMYIGHLCVIRRQLVQGVGGFRIGFEGSQDYDLVLRVIEKTQNIFHIPKILYHWRLTPTSTAGGFSAKPYAHDAGLRALQEHAKRTWGINGCEVRAAFQYFQYEFFFPVRNQPLISIIIPTKDQYKLLNACIKSIISKTAYRNYEIIVLNNNSELPETLQFFEQLTSDSNWNTRVIDCQIPFNWSKLNNIGIAQAKGDVYVFLNNDIEVISNDWLDWLVGYALREDIGVVGPLLLYPDNTIQHAGVVVGIGGYADHVFKGQNIDIVGSYFVSPRLLRNVSAVTGACMAIAKNKIEQVGGFDENFMICGSDVEMCLRFLKSGLRNVYIPQVQLYHHESKSRGSHIPDIDFVMSRQAYEEFITNGDPYYNPNLTLEAADAAIRISF